MATMNLFEMMGIKLEEEKETTTEVKKEKKKKTPSKKKNTSKKEETSYEIGENGINIITGYYPVFNIPKEQFEKNSVDASDIIKIVSKKYNDFLDGMCKLKKLKNDSFLITFSDENRLGAAKKLEGEWKICRAGFETTMRGEITLESIEDMWVEQYPTFRNKVEFQYSEEGQILCPIFKKDLKMQIPKEPFVVSIWGQEAFQFSEMENISEKLITDFINSKYPDLEGEYYTTWIESEKVMYITPYIKKATTVAKKEMFPTNATLSLAFRKIPLSPELFNGKDEVEASEILSFIAEDYPEYSPERTQVEYEKKLNMIILMLKSSKKGCNINDVVRKIPSNTDFYIGSVEDEGTRYRIEKTPLGIFVAGGPKSNFKMHLPKIPGKLLQEIHAFFNAVCSYKPHSNEAAAQIFWDMQKKEYLVYYPKQIVGTVSVEYERSVLMEQNYLLVMDVHSHGDIRNFFSATDDADEKGTRLFGVFGMVRDNNYHISMRAGTGGKFIPLQVEDVVSGMHDEMCVKEISQRNAYNIIADRVVFSH